ncbi:hypothetical protein KCU95_g20075, partial [Aureobasidium melanogenum]
TAAGIPTWSPTVVLICRSTAYVWQSGRDAQFSADCGPRNSSLVSDTNPSLSSRCMTFQTRIDSYTIELDRLEAMNKAIHKEYDKRKQEQQRDRLIDSASPEPDRGSATVREDKHKMVFKKLRQRRRRLTRGLAVMKEKMEKLKTEIESVCPEMNVGDL